jgi:serine/threonine protein phosphatase PrpC
MVKSYFTSLKGLRQQNEDTHVIIENVDNVGANVAHNGGANVARINFYAIYDGHGGKSTSQYLKDTLPLFFNDVRVKYPLTKKYIVSVYDHIQNKLKEMKNSAHTGSTALVVIYFKVNNDGYLNIINVGDCRCILARNNFAIPLTKDHKPNMIEERRRIEKLGGVIIYDEGDWRINGLSVSRAFADLDATPAITHRPDIFKYKIDRTDKFIVLGCDGLYDMLSNDDIVNFVLSSCYDATLTKRINQHINIAKRLGDYAISKGSTDNVSVIVVFFD